MSMLLLAISIHNRYMFVLDRPFSPRASVQAILASSDIRGSLFAHASSWILKQTAAHERLIPYADQVEVDESYIALPSNLEEAQAAFFRENPPGVIFVRPGVIEDVDNYYGRVFNNYCDSSSLTQIGLNQLKLSTETFLMRGIEQISKTKYYKSENINSSSLDHALDDLTYTQSKIWHSGHPNEAGLAVSEEGTLFFAGLCDNPDLQRRILPNGSEEPSSYDQHIFERTLSLTYECRRLSEDVQTITEKQIEELRQRCVDLAMSICLPEGIDRARIVRAPPGSIFLFPPNADRQKGFHCSPFGTNPSKYRPVYSAKMEAQP